MLEFKKCAACAAKPGSPILCISCLHNRETIAQLEAAGNYLAAEVKSDWDQQRQSIDCMVARGNWLETVERLGK